MIAVREEAGEEKKMMLHLLCSFIILNLYFKMPKCPFNAGSSHATFLLLFLLALFSIK